MHYLVSCVYHPVSCMFLHQLRIFDQLCITRSVSQVICALLGQLHITRSVVYYSASCGSRLVSCMMTLSVVYHYSVSSVTLRQLYDNSVTVVHYSVSCMFFPVSCVFSVSSALLGRLCITLSVVLHSIICMIIPSVVFSYSVSCALLS